MVNFLDSSNFHQNNFNIKATKENKNILFIGSCRMFSVVNYFLLLDIFSNYNLYNIYVPDFDNKEVPIGTINKIIKNTKIIICETVRSYKFLNTENTVPNNIFQTYDIPKSCKIVNVSNLEFAMYYKDLLRYSPKRENFFKIRNQSLQRFTEKLLNNKEYNIKECVDKYLFNQEFPLFYTINHPGGLLSVLSFKNICNNLKIEISKSKILKNYATDLKYFSLFGNNTVLTYWDQKMYNTTFCKSFDNNYCDHCHCLKQNQYEIDIELESKILPNYI